MVCCIFSECKNMTLWEMLSWRCPKVTGLLLAVVLSVIAFFFFMDYTLVTFLCRVLQLLLILGAVFSLILKRQLTSDDIECAINKFVETAAPLTVMAANTVYDVVTWRDLYVSGVVSVASFFLAFLGTCLSDCSFALIITLLAFTVPVVYDKKKDVIEEWIAVGKAQVNKYMGVVKTKMDDAIKKRN